MRDGHAYLNRNAQRIADSMIEDADRLGVSHSRGSLGEHLIDAGANSPGGIEAALRIVEICLGGLGTVSAGLSAWQVALFGRCPLVATGSRLPCQPVCRLESSPRKVLRHGFRSRAGAGTGGAAFRGNRLPRTRGSIIGDRAGNLDPAAGRNHRQGIEGDRACP